MEALADVVSCAIPLEPALAVLDQFAWDWDGPPLLLAKKDVDAVLRRLAEGELMPQQVQRWAEFLEGRDDLDYDGEVAQLLFLLATPEVNEPISAELAERLLRGSNGTA